MKVFQNNKFKVIYKINGVDANLYTMPFGRQIDGLRIIKSFLESGVKEAWVDGNARAVKAWIKEHNPKEYYSQWADSPRHYIKDDSAKIWFKM